MAKDLNSQLLSACELGDTALVQALLKKGANPNTIGKNSGVLHEAALLGNEKVVKILLKHGANPNTKDKQNFAPLHLAASRGHVAICNLLLKAKADIDARAQNGAAALHIAVAGGFLPMVLALVKAGCDIDAKDDSGNTPLASACVLGNLNIVRSLIKAGADVYPKDKKGATMLIHALWALHAARIENWSYQTETFGVSVLYQIKKGSFRFVYDYIKSQKKLGRVLTQKEQQEAIAADWGPKAHQKYLDTVAVVKLLVNAGVNVLQKNNDGLSPMRIACHTGVGEIIKLLHDKGATFDNEKWNGVTELHHVAGSGRLDGLEVFFKLAGKQDCNALDKYGWTPAHYLADTGGPLEMANLLIQNGADVSIGSTKQHADFPIGTTAAKVALHWQDMDLALALN